MVALLKRFWPAASGFFFFRSTDRLLIGFSTMVCFPVFAFIASVLDEGFAEVFLKELFPPLVVGGCPDERTSRPDSNGVIAFRFLLDLRRGDGVWRLCLSRLNPPNVSGTSTPFRVLLDSGRSSEGFSAPSCFGSSSGIESGVGSTTGSG